MGVFTVVIFKELSQIRLIMAMKILAAADLHLGRRSTGLTGNTEILSTKSAWLRLVKWAIDNKMDAVALAGDVVDQDNNFFESIGPLQTGFQRLGDAGIEVFLTTGNHDYMVLPQLIEDKYPHVHLLGKSGQWQVTPFSRHGETVQFLGWSFPTQYVKTSPVAAVRREQLDPNYPVIGLLHADLDNPGSNYCPVVQSELVGIGVGTWILGHIHKPGVWNLPGTSIHYPGSLQALSAKESGPHGFLLLTIAGRNLEIQEVQLSTVRYQGLSVDITHADTRESFRQILLGTVNAHARSLIPDLEGVKNLIYDLNLIGEHPDEILVRKWADESKNDTALPVGAGTIASIRSLSSAVRPVIGDLAELAQEPSPAGSLASIILAIREGKSTPLLTLLQQDWEQQRQQLKSAPIYQPLAGTAAMENATLSASEYLQRECNKLLSVLLSQTKKTH
jgi:DNA repair protein SbcD/Mre11